MQEKSSRASPASGRAVKASAPRPAGRAAARTQADRNAATRAALIAAGRKVFAETGFADASTEAIVAGAGVTRGALYHHFADKTALFAVVVEAVSVEVLGEIEAAAGRARTARSAVTAGVRAFLAASLKEDRRRIYLVDAPAVIGWSAWRALDARHGMGSLREGLEAAAAEAGRKLADAAIAVHLLSGAMNEAALMLASASDSGARLRRVETALDAMIDAILA